MRATIYILRTISVLSFLYFLLVIYVSGLKTSFLWFWFFVAGFSLGLSFFIHGASKSTIRTVSITGTVFTFLVWIGLVIVLLFEGFLLVQSKQPAKEQADYLIVLGAQVRGSRPSKALNMRILTAADYLNENPDTLVICSGGKGSGEDISEAQCIKEGLIELGISEQRILLEAASTNTVENLKFSKELISDTDAQVVIVTNDFHTFRARCIAKKLGYQNISSCSADTFMVTTISYYVREMFAVVKDWLVGNIG